MPIKCPADGQIGWTTTFYEFDRPAHSSEGPQRTIYGKNQSRKTIWTMEVLSSQSEDQGKDSDPPYQNFGTDINKRPQQK